MKVLMINGSPRVGGNTSIALGEMAKIFAEEQIETETIQIGGRDIPMAADSCSWVISLPRRSLLMFSPM